jgi:arylformamidase
MSSDPDAPGAVLYDLSPTIDETLPVWPGDTPFQRRWIARLEDGAAVNLSTIAATVHLGSHADAPLHTEPAGAAIDAVPLSAYVGPCRVLTVGAAELALPEHLPPFCAGATPRVLLKTGSADGGGAFPERFTAVSPALARHLMERGVVLLGTDCPSVDPFSSKALEAHHILLGGGVAVLEGLLLRDVPPGPYELVALPLKLGGLDASPVRAILRRLA